MKPLTDLKMCPWCGYHNACPTTDDDGFHFVECGTCMARGPISRSSAKAVEHWNRPADFEGAVKDVKEVLAWYTSRKRPDVRLAILEGHQAGVDSVRFRDLPELVGCGDNSCIVRTKRQGMGTNGGCRCDERQLRRAVQALRATLDKLNAARTP